MLPRGVYSISSIKSETNVADRLVHAGSTLDYLFGLIEPADSFPDQPAAGLKDSIDKNRGLFSNADNVLFANRVRNCVVHPKNCKRLYSEAEELRASEHFIRAVSEACHHPAVPVRIRTEILVDSRSAGATKAPSQWEPPQGTSVSGAPPTNYAPRRSITYSGRQRTSAPGKLFKLLVAALVIGFADLGIVRLSRVVRNAWGNLKPSAASQVEFVNSERVNLRTGPGAEYPVVAKLSRADSVICIERRQSKDRGTWTRVRSGGIEGWVNQELLSVKQPAPPTRTVDTGVLGAFLDDLDGKSLGDAYGVTFVPTPTGLGASFTRSAESRIEYPGRIHFPSQGTLEWRILVQSGYSYSKGQLQADKPEACIFTTTGPDTYYPGSTWVIVNRDGTVTFLMADSKGGQTPLRKLVAAGTAFRFGEWHTVGVSYGPRGRFIRVDGQDVAHDDLGLPLAVGGDLLQQTDMPTIGQMLSRFGWARNQYDSAFEGVVDTFRASWKQTDWDLSR